MLIPILIIITIVFISIYCIYAYRQKEEFNDNIDIPDLYGILITGKDDCRLELARNSIENFFSQDYQGKLRLVIVNHHNDSVITDENNDILEIKIEKSLNTLGDMRNIALEMIPINTLWTTWDDDDYRPSDYLSTLYNIMIKQKVNAIAFTDRYEFNISKKALWKIRLNSGFVTILARRIYGLAYLPKDSMEDVNIKSFYPDLFVYNNTDKLMYVRLIHTNNTSLYVDSNKEKASIDQQKNLVYQEFNLTEKEKETILHFISPYFKRVQCLTSPN
jgi:hypothetical protein